MTTEQSINEEAFLHDLRAEYFEKQEYERRENEQAEARRQGEEARYTQEFRRIFVKLLPDGCEPYLTMRRLPATPLESCSSWCATVQLPEAAAVRFYLAPCPEMRADISGRRDDRRQAPNEYVLKHFMVAHTADVVNYDEDDVLLPEPKLVYDDYSFGNSDLIRDASVRAVRLALGEALARYPKFLQQAQEGHAKLRAAANRKFVQEFADQQRNDLPEHQLADELYGAALNIVKFVFSNRSIGS